jgi:hypothetical protein
MSEAAEPVGCHEVVTKPNRRRRRRIRRRQRSGPRGLKQRVETRHAELSSVRVRLTGPVHRSWPLGSGDLAGVAMTERRAGGPRLASRPRGLAVAAWLDSCRAAVGCGPGVRVQVLPAGDLPDAGDLLWSGGRPPLRQLRHGQVCARSGPLGVKPGLQLAASCSLAASASVTSGCVPPTAWALLLDVIDV